MCLTIFTKEELLEQLSPKASDERNEEVLRMLYAKVKDDESKRLVTKMVTDLHMNEVNEENIKSFIVKMKKLWYNR